MLDDAKSIRDAIGHKSRRITVVSQSWSTSVGKLVTECYQYLGPGRLGGSR